MPKIGLRPRPRPRTYTDQIGRKAAENICHAFDYAKHIGQPLNRHITINMRHAGDHAAVAHLFGSIRHKFRDWMNYAAKRRGMPTPKPAYVYSIESPDEGHPHAHWVVHVPKHLSDDFQAKLMLWAARVLDGVGPFDVVVQEVNPMTDKSLAKYVVKGTDARFVEYLHLGAYAAPQGRVWGRRATASQAIGRTARKRAGFKPKRDRHKWKAALLAAE